MRARRLALAALAALCLVPGTTGAETGAALVPHGHISAGDPLLPEQWWLAPVGADRAEPPGPGRPVTVIDTGVDLTHPELAGRPDTIALNPQTIGTAAGEQHGTQVASVLAAPADGAGLVGVYPQAVLRVWDAGSDVGGLIEGLEAASRAGPGVINVSLGTRPSQALEEAVYAAVRRGSLVVASVGNERAQGSPQQYPAGIPHVLTVAAVDRLDAVAPFSNASPAVDLAAPGTEIRVAVPLSFNALGYGFAQGTSFASAIVSGAAAWIWTQRPDLDAGQVAELLRRTARDVGPPGFDEDTGFGVLDIPAALAAEPPAPDPREPNDDIRLVKGGGLFSAGITPLVSPAGPRRGGIAGTIDAVEDPRDVYPLWMPGRGSVTVTLTGDADVDLELWRPDAFSVQERGAARRASLAARSAVRGVWPEVATAENPKARGRFWFAVVRPAPGTRRAGYTLRVVTRARR